MAARDPHRYVNELDEASIERLIARLESRAKDQVFTRLFDKYASRIVAQSPARVLEVGSGTGSMLRALARRPDFRGVAVGVEQSPAFVEAARRLAREEGVGDRVTFEVGDAHKLELPDASFDAVIINTVISHVSDARAVLGELARVVRKGGTVAIFDGDYASMTYAYPDFALGRRMDWALVTATFNNPSIMRELPALLPRYGLRITEAWGDAVAEIGKASFFKSFAETYVPYVINAGLEPAEVVQRWHAVQQEAMEKGTFFGACNYYTYLAQRVA
ncbi:MAG: methyltransferase domain-containing protein [Pseudomonadota bacterium]